jgi:hypothetical protein
LPQVYYKLKVFESEDDELLAQRNRLHANDAVLRVSKGLRPNTAVSTAGSGAYAVRGGASLAIRHLQDETFGFHSLMGLYGIGIRN